MTPTPAGGNFSMTSEAEQLVRLRKWLREELAGHDVPKHEQPNLLLAVGEICANSIQHAYDGRGGQPIHVSVRSSADSLVIEVEDFGKPFDAELYESPELDAAPDSGYGLFLVKTIADSLSFDVDRERGTRWTIVKYRSGRGPTAGKGSGTPRG
jgi:anti-sigma regulatory factor (Ser/Thr protein kinase)